LVKVWKGEDGTWSKFPFGKQRGSWQTPENRWSYEEADDELAKRIDAYNPEVLRARLAQGIPLPFYLGLVMTKDDDLFYIDLDDCFNEDRTLNERGQRFEPIMQNCYCEISPSGKGLKVIGRSALGLTGKRVLEREGVHQETMIVFSGGLTTITGNVFRGYTYIAEDAGLTEEMVKKSKKPDIEYAALPPLPKVDRRKVPQQVRAMLRAPAVKGERSEELFSAYMACFDHGLQVDEVLALIKESEYWDSVTDKTVDWLWNDIQRAKANHRQDFEKVVEGYGITPEFKVINLLSGTELISKAYNHMMGFDQAFGQLLEDGAPVVTGRTWYPGKPLVLKDQTLGDEGQLLSTPGESTRNSWHAPPQIRTKETAGPWIEHVRRLYPEAAEHIFSWFAYLLQNQDKKINHALIFGGAQGIGKDTIIHPLKQYLTVNDNVNIRDLFHNYTGQLGGFKLLVLQEARDSGHHNLREINEILKPWLTQPPVAIQINPKYGRVYWQANLAQFVIMTNDEEGLHLGEGERRYYPAWSVIEEPPPADYFTALYQWMDKNWDAVVQFLLDRDVSDWDPTGIPPRTQWYKELRESSKPVLSHVIQDMGEHILTKPMVVSYVKMMEDEPALPRARRGWGAVWKGAGFVRVPNPDEKRGRWLVDGHRTDVYCTKDVTNVVDAVQQWINKRMN
jgi:hypothetical protein